MPLAARRPQSPESVRVRRAAALIFICAALLPARAVEEKKERPLLALARKLWEKQSPDHVPIPGNTAVRAAEHELNQARVPNDAECARSLGAQRFAMLHLQLGLARMEAGEFEAAAAAYGRAQACKPRDASMYGLLAEALFAARQYADARAAVDEGLALDPRSPALYRQAGTLDFVAGSWASATARFRYVAAGEPDRLQAEFAQLMFWLAQRRAGVPRPQFVERVHDEDWPRPLMRFLEGEFSEANLVQHVRADDVVDNYEHEAEDDELPFASNRRLCQALFYVGEAHWARGDSALAREYLAAAINLKAFELTEHQIALAEILKLRDR